MRTSTIVGAALLPLTIALAACSVAPTKAEGTNPRKAAHFVYIDDVSTSPATMIDHTVAKAVERRIGDDLSASVQLGDTITVYESGGRSADRMVAHPSIVTDYNLRIPAAHAQLTQQLRDIASRFQAQGGDNATNLLLTLESIRPKCTPRSTVTLVTDGVEESDAYSAAKALNGGKPVSLPQPPFKYLAGCRVRFIGFGLTADPLKGGPQLMPARQLAALRQGWTSYLEAAGVQTQDIEFISAL